MLVSASVYFSLAFFVSIATQEPRVGWYFPATDNVGPFFSCYYFIEFNYQLVVRSSLFAFSAMYRTCNAQVPLK